MVTVLTIIGIVILAVTILLTIMFFIGFSVFLATAGRLDDDAFYDFTPEREDYDKIK